MLKNFEGCRLAPYKCQAGKWTVGYGHVIPKTKEGQYVISIAPGSKITQEKANQYLSEDIARFEKCVQTALGNSLTNNQFDALVSFVFNIGEQAFKTSHFVIYWNQRKYTAAVRELERWCHIKDPVTGQPRISPGLLKRRLAERDYFLGKTVDHSHDCHIFDPKKPTVPVCNHLPIPKEELKEFAEVHNVVRA